MSRLQKSAPGVDINTHRGGMVHGLLNPAVPSPTLKAKVHIIICTLYTYRYSSNGCIWGDNYTDRVCMQYTQEMLDITHNKLVSKNCDVMHTIKFL